MFNVPPAAKVTWRWDHGLESHLTNWKSLKLNLGRLDTRQLVYSIHHRGGVFYNSKI